tara:strand:- start:430 stop:867 length:438 start_codon:yes stop_codon:yes gene_type:complete
MPNINEMMPSTSKFLASTDIGTPDDPPVCVTMRSVSMDTVGQGADAQVKPILALDEFEKGLALNKTNGEMIAAFYGVETDNWTGKRIALYTTFVEFQGKAVQAIRIHSETTSRLKSEAAQPNAQQAAQQFQAPNPPMTDPADPGF